MGFAKQQMIRHHEAQQVGIEIGVRAGVLDRCQGHEECYWITFEDEREAYKLASALIRDHDPLVAGFGRDDILDGVKAAIADAGIDGCAHCASIMAKD